MSEAKPFASLGPSLLARKGAARPAMRPQTQPIHGASGGLAQLDDLGWNDMGEAAEAQNAAALPLPLTPAPANPEEDARSVAEDRAERAKLVTGPLPGPIPAKPEVRRQIEAIQNRLTPASEPAAKAAREAAPAAPAPQAAAVAPVAAPEPRETAPAPAPARAPARPRKSALKQGRKAAFTLRLDAERHLKLRLACTLNNQSAQQLVTEALDLLIGRMPEVASLAAQVRRPEK